MAVQWKKVSKARYWDMLEILPPAVMGAGGFMVGEPVNHDEEGNPRFAAFLERNGQHFEASEPMTIKAYRAINPAAADYSYSEEGAI